MDKARGVAIFVALSLAGATAWAAVPGCPALAGKYAFFGTADEASPAYPMGQAPNVALALLLGGELSGDPRLTHYLAWLEDDRLMLELHSRERPLWRVDVTGPGDFAYCLDGELVIERQRRAMVSAVYEYRRYRHRLGVDGEGSLWIETEVAGKYRTPLTAWPSPKQTYRASFPRLGEEAFKY